MTQQSKLGAAWGIRLKNFPPVIRFDYPFNTLVVSLTGSSCELNCAHCGGYYLRHMVPVWEATSTVATSCLISGGCDTRGRVPVTTHLDAVGRLRPGKIMNWHSGLIGQDEAKAIAGYVDVFSFDFVGDDQAIAEVYGLEAGVKDYIETYRLLRSFALVVPHITVGLRGGQLCGEYRALEILDELGADALTFIVLIPTPGTRYANCEPPPPAAVADLIATARLRFPSTPLHLGCMRPRGAYRDELDALAVQAGVNAIVSPSRAAV
ncbi:MAG: radical SAM protein, partial [Anaerolineae bacterium]|nr:radical SAM protein [Anaerolineae bacterium]